MIQSFSRTPLYSASRMQQKAPLRSKEATLSDAFANQVSKAIATTSASRQKVLKASIPAAAARIATAPAPLTPMSNVAPRQYIVTGAGATATSPGSMFGQAPGPASAETQSAIAQLADALQAAGIDPNQLSMVAHDDVAGFPGGSYTNQLITLKANGNVEHFSAKLIPINPNVAVTEIKRLLGMG